MGYDWRVRDPEAVKLVAAELTAPSEAALLRPAKRSKCDCRERKPKVVKPGFDARHLRAFLSILN